MMVQYDLLLLDTHDLVLHHYVCHVHWEYLQITIHGFKAMLSIYVTLFRLLAKTSTKITAITDSRSVVMATLYLPLKWWQLLDLLTKPMYADRVQVVSALNLHNSHCVPSLIINTLSHA